MEEEKLIALVQKIESVLGKNFFVKLEKNWDEIIISNGFFKFTASSFLKINYEDNSLRFLNGSTRKNFEKIISILPDFGLNISEENYLDEGVR